MKSPYKTLLLTRILLTPPLWFNMAVSKSGSSSNNSSSESPLFEMKSKGNLWWLWKSKTKHGNNDDYNNGNGADDTGYNKSTVHNPGAHGVTCQASINSIQGIWQSRSIYQVKETISKSKKEFQVSNYHNLHKLTVTRISILMTWFSIIETRVSILEVWDSILESFENQESSLKSTGLRHKWLSTYVWAVL